MKFRKKPVVIEAEQFFPERRPWPAGVEAETRDRSCSLCGDSTYDHMCNDGVVPTGRHIVVTLEGPMVASPGDWIITGVKGERYPCKPDIFAATYEPVEP